MDAVKRHLDYFAHKLLFATMEEVNLYASDSPFLRYVVDSPFRIVSRRIRSDESEFEVVHDASGRSFRVLVSAKGIKQSEILAK